MGTANSLVSISAWESNRALNGPIFRIRRQGGEPVFLIMQPVDQPSSHIHEPSSMWIFFNYFLRGKKGEREEKKGNFFKTMKSLYKGYEKIYASII